MSFHTMWQHITSLHVFQLLGLGVSKIEQTVGDGEKVFVAKAEDGMHVFGADTVEGGQEATVKGTIQPGDAVAVTRDTDGSLWAHVKADFEAAFQKVDNEFKKIEGEVEGTNATTDVANGDAATQSIHSLSVEVDPAVAGVNQNTQTSDAGPVTNTALDAPVEGVSDSSGE